MADNFSELTRNISVEVQAALSKNIDKFDDWKGSFQNHHVITLENAKNSDFLQEVYGNAYLDRFNSQDNLIRLPNSIEDARVAGLAPHRGGHQPYRRAITEMHDQMLEAYNAEKFNLYANYGDSYRNYLCTGNYGDSYRNYWNYGDSYRITVTVTETIAQARRKRNYGDSYRNYCTGSP